MRSLSRKIIILLSCILLPMGAVAESDTETKAQYAYMIDYNTGTVLFEKDAETPMHPSSMTKIMTSYLIFNALKRGEITLETKFPVSENAWKKGGSRMFLKEGDSVSVIDLLRGIIIQSGNDACVVVAEGLAGSEEAFADEMNFMGNKLGLTGSKFKNSTGWPDDEHLMTARDLVVLAKHVIDDFPEYYPYFSEKSFTYNNIHQINRNKLLERDFGVDGFKTGYTEDAGYGIVASAEQDGRRLILAINGLKSNKERISEAERLLRYGFRDFKNVSLYKAGDVVENAEVWLGKKSSVPLIVEENVEFTTGKRASRKSDIELSVMYEGPMPAPIVKGTHIANLVIKKGGKVDRVLPLVAGESVEKLSFFGRLLTLPSRLF